MSPLNPLSDAPWPVLRSHGLDVKESDPVELRATRRENVPARREAEAHAVGVGEVVPRDLGQLPGVEDGEVAGPLAAREEAAVVVEPDRADAGLQQRATRELGAICRSGSGTLRQVAPPPPKRYNSQGPKNPQAGPAV